MKVLPLYLVAATLSISGAAYALDPMPPSAVDANKTGDKLQNMGKSLADEATIRHIQGDLSKTVNDGLMDKHFDNFVGHLSKGDRDRIGDFKNQKFDDLDRVIAQFRADFKAKYHQDFDLRPEHIRDAMVYGGADKNSATVSLAEMTFLGNADLKTRDVRTSVTDTSVKTDVVKTDHSIVSPPIDVAVTGKSGTTIETDTSVSPLGQRTGPGAEGNNTSTVIRGGDLPPAGTAVVTGTETRTTTDIRDKSIADNRLTGPGLTLNLINEGTLAPAWKINIPDQITGDQLKGNLVKHIQMLDDQKAAWPAEVGNAYRAAAFHVLSSLNDSGLATER